MSAGLLSRERIEEFRKFGIDHTEAGMAEYMELLDLAEVGLMVRAEEARREAHKRNCPHCGVADPKYRDGACQSCGEPGK